MYKIDNDNLTQLVVDAINGVEGSFEELYKQTIKFSYATASLMLKNEEDIEDALQNSYMYVASSIKNLKKPESFINWLSVIVKHECQKYITKNKRISDIFLNVLRTKEFDSEAEEIPDFDFVEKREISDAVQEIVNRLSDDKRACVVLYYFEQHTLPEISSILGIPEGTVKSRLHSARKFIEKEFRKLRKDDTTLYGITAIPLIVAFLAFQAETAAVPVAVAEGASACLAAVSGGAVATATTAAASGSIAAATASGTAVAGSTAAGSVAAGSAVAIKVAAVAVAATVAVGGGVTTAKHIKESREATTVHNADVSVTEEYATVAQTGADLPQETESESVLSDMLNGTSFFTVAQTDSISLQRTQTSSENTTVKTTVPETTESTVAKAEETKSTVAETQETTKEETETQQTTQTETQTQAPTETEPEPETETEPERETETPQPTTSAADVFSVSGGVLNEYKGDGLAVSVPSSVDSQDVIAIGAGAFEGNTDITSVSMPSSVTKIGQLAFEDCSNLRSVSLPSSLTSIGGGAFYGCSSLTQVSIPSGVTSIGDDAFADCTNLSSVTVPESVTSIGDNAFGGCDNVTVKCKEGSAAHDYVLENAINYELI
ncbi:MAG: sigma-70 family RNA polymerase sigma factor [Clostridia bacterium]|nr:sigma-70 family RNA polymerase sigma factor [Clostridia bacterium]